MIQNFLKSGTLLFLIVFMGCNSRPEEATMKQGGGTVEIFSATFAGPITALADNPYDGRLYFAVGNQVKRIDLTTFAKEDILTEISPVLSMSVNGPRSAYALDNVVKVFDDEEKRIDLPQGTGVPHLAFSSDRDYLLIARMGGNVSVHDFEKDSSFTFDGRAFGFNYALWKGSVTLWLGSYAGLNEYDWRGQHRRTADVDGLGPVLAGVAAGWHDFSHKRGDEMVILTDAMLYLWRHTLPSRVVSSLKLNSANPTTLAVFPQGDLTAVGNQNGSIDFYNLDASLARFVESPGSLAGPASFMVWAENRGGVYLLVACAGNQMKIFGAKPAQQKAGINH